MALGDQIVRALRQRVRVLPFHADWIKATFADDIQISAMSCPRGSAKSWCVGHLAALGLRPGSPLFQPGIETLVVSASLEQSRIILGFVREALDVFDDYRWLDSGQRLAVTHKATGTKLRVLSSSGKRAMGLSQFHTIYADEPGNYEVRGGALMFDALRRSLGKRPGRRLVMIGTRAPAEDGSWWPSFLLDGGSGPGTHVTVLTAPDSEPWDAWSTIRRVNSLVMHNEALRKTILRERDDARCDESQRPAFEAYRLNRQVEVYKDMLILADAWRRVEARPLPEREDRPLVGLDLGAERSWSAAWCIWPNGRSECYAVCPGIPGLAERERQGAMPRGLYRKLHDDGVLLVDEGFRVSRPATLIDHLVEIGIVPEVIYCDRFALGTLKDAVAGRWPIIDRVARWSEATEDITGFRRLVADGPVVDCRGMPGAGAPGAVAGRRSQ